MSEDHIEPEHFELKNIDEVKSFTSRLDSFIIQNIEWPLLRIDLVSAYGILQPYE